MFFVNAAVSILLSNKHFLKSKSWLLGGYIAEILNENSKFEDLTGFVDLLLFCSNYDANFMIRFSTIKRLNGNFENFSKLSNKHYLYLILTLNIASEWSSCRISKFYSLHIYLYNCV